ncbi:MAG: alpha-glucan family phosphorylase, partial [bacterium]
YDINKGKMLVSGVDIWLNTPLRPKEASGTSGMKAAHNGVPHFSVLDGWWIEGHIENITGWSIGDHPNKRIENNQKDEVEDLYMKLEYLIIPTYYNERERWIDMMQHCIAINGSFFNTHRMVQQYVLNAYFL